MLTVMWVMVVQCLVMFVLAFYFEMVVPRKYGSPLPWYFPLERLYRLVAPAKRIELDEVVVSSMLLFFPQVAIVFGGGCVYSLLTRDDTRMCLRSPEHG